MAGTGVLTLTGGTLQLGNNTPNGTINGGLAFDLTAAATLDFKRSDEVIYSGKLAGSAKLVQSGAGNLILVGLNNYTGTTTVSSGTLTLAAGATMGAGGLSVASGAGLILQAPAATSALTGAGTVTIAPGVALTLNALSGNPLFSGVFSGVGDLVKSGAGDLVLAGDSSGFSGAVTVTGGMISVQNPVSTLGSGDITVTGNATLGAYFGAAPYNTSGQLKNNVKVVGGTLTLGRNGTTVMAGEVVASGPGSIVIGGGGTVVIEKDIANVGTGTLRVAAGSTLQLGNGGTTGTFNGGLAFPLSAGNLAFNRSDDLAYTGALTGTAALIQTGMGNLTVTGTNTYSGGTTVKSGTLTLGGPSALGKGAVTIAGDGVLDLGNQAIANSVQVNGGTLRGGSIDATKVAASAGVISATLDGSGILTKSGPGTLVLTGENIYSGGTRLNDGTLTVGGGSALGAGPVTLTGGVLDLNGQTVGNALVLGSAVIGGSGTLTGVISGDAPFTKVGTGTLTLTGQNLHSGGTLVVEGRLVIGDNAGLGSGAAIVSGGNLDLGGTTPGNTITLSSGLLSGSELNGDKLVLEGGELAGVIVAGALTKTSGGTVLLSAANRSPGGTTVAGGTLEVNHADALGAGPVRLSGGTLDIKGQTIRQSLVVTDASGVSSADGAIDGVIEGQGLLTKLGAGTLTLNAVNTLTGGVLISAGTLVVNGEVFGSTVVAASGKLAGAGFLHDVTVVAGGSVNAGAIGSVGSLRADTLSLQGGATVGWDLASASLGPGQGFDQFLVDGSLDLSAASPGNQYRLVLAGLPADFDGAGRYSFVLFKYGSLNLGGNASITDLFVIDAAGLSDQSGESPDASRFSLVDDATNRRILLNYEAPSFAPIPEPSTYGLGLGFLGLAIAAIRRRRQAVG
jgi:autotransporter-associated beta strand protein